MDVTLMTDIENKFVLRRVENPVERDRQLHNSQVWTEVAPGLGEDTDQFRANLFGQTRQVFFFDPFTSAGE